MLISICAGPSRSNWDLIAKLSSGQIAPRRPGERQLDSKNEETSKINRISQYTANNPRDINHLLSVTFCTQMTRTPQRSDKALGETTKDKAGTFVAMIASEAEAVGKFVGDCISTPTVQAGTLLSVLGYMLYTEPLLGLIVLLIAVPQVFAVPMIQRRINTLVRERVVTVRRAGDLVVDNMQGAGGSSSSSLGSEIGKAFEAIYGVRLRVFKLKFGLKLLVSGLQSGGVFLLLFVGGIMVLNGKTEIGIVVAFISGLDRAIDPWRELIAFVRSTSAAKGQFDLIEGTLGQNL